MTTELDVAIDGDATVHDAEAVSSAVERQLLDQIPSLSVAHVRVRPVSGTIDDQDGHEHAAHHHGPDPVPVTATQAR